MKLDRFLLRVGLGSLAIAGVPAAAQSVVGPATRPLPAPADVLAYYDTAAGTLQDLDLPFSSEQGFAVEVFLDDAWRTLSLYPYDVRSDDFVLVVQDAHGYYVAPTPPSVTFRGHVRGYPESRVAASLVDGELQAVVVLEPGRTALSIQPASEARPGLARSVHLVHDDADAVTPPGVCGTEDQQGSVTLDGADHLLDVSQATYEMICEIACDTDVQFYNANGSSVVATQNDITTIVNGVEAIYLSDVGIGYSITTIIVRTAEPDPYTTSNPSALLDQVQQEWIVNQAGVQRDTAHMFTGRNLSGSTIGIAWLSSICTKTSGYGLSQSRWSSNFARRVGLTAHELGHSWSADHCNGDADCRIMCSGIGGCTGNFTSFGSAAIASILNRKNGATCLTATVAPTLTQVSPGSVAALGGAELTLTGTALCTALQVEVDGHVLERFLDEFTIVDDDTITVAPPTATSLGAAPVVVHGSGGSSQSQTFDFVPTDPALLIAPGFGNTLAPFTWRIGAQPGDLYLIYYTVNNPTTVPFQGWTILLAAKFSNFFGNVDAAGLGVRTFVPGPAQNLSYKTLYTQVVMLDDLTFGLADITNIEVTPFGL